LDTADDATDRRAVNDEHQRNLRLTFALEQPDFSRMTAECETSRAAHRRTVALPLVCVVIGGLIGWTAAFSGMGLWGLAIGLVVAVAITIVLARRQAATRRVGSMLTLGFGFMLLTWPFLWLAVGYVRYLITGDTLGA
jgi:F0F1-type ATP synthase assembly protein I